MIERVAFRCTPKLLCSFEWNFAAIQSKRGFTNLRYGMSGTRTENFGLVTV